MHQLTLLRLDRSQFAQKTLFDLRRPWGHFYCICVWGTESKWCCKKTLRQRSMDPRSSKSKSFFALQHNIEHLKVIKSFQQCEESISRWLFRKHDFQNQMIFWRISYFCWWVHFPGAGTSDMCSGFAPSNFALGATISRSPIVQLLPLLITLGLWITPQPGW